MIWFSNNHEMMTKIRKKYQKNFSKEDMLPETNEVFKKMQSDLVKKTILDEYTKCASHFESLKDLEPKTESASQIERDLGRTFPKNEFFKVKNTGFLKLR